MFHHYSENSSSTGEPPTPPTINDSIDSEPTQNISSDNINQVGPSQMSLSSSRDTSRTLPVQESDSGYEASPSSLGDNTSSYQFFGDQSVAMTNQIIQPHPSRQRAGEEIEFLEPRSPFALVSSQSDLEEWDTCNSSNNCNYYRTDSSTTNVTTATSDCDNATTASSSRSNSSDISSSRPSSQPIQIPILHSCRIRRNSAIVDPNIDFRLHPVRSQPVDFSRLQTFAFVTGSHPLSWPSTASPWRTQRSTLALPIFINDDHTVWHISATNRLRRSNCRIRSRRQIIDSDASSISSSDEDGPTDEVFLNMAVEDTSTSFALCPMVSSGGGSSPPPVLDSPTSECRRSRSVSVNLPPDRELLASIGSRLRRLSDQFQIRREITMGTRSRRRQTIGSITQLNGIS